jgi:hypothetical protein
MKTKTFFLICLLLGIGLTRLSAQNGQNGTTGSYSERYSWTFDIPVFCNGQQVDLLTGELEWHHKAHFQNGDWLTCFVQLFGEAVSVGFIDANGNKIGGTGEVFDVQAIGKQDNNIQPDGTWDWVVIMHANVQGNMGSHYIGTFSWDSTWTYISFRAICN